MKNLFLLFSFLLFGFTESCANNQFSEKNPTKYLGNVATEIITILDYSINAKGEYLIYGLTKENQLIRQLISTEKHKVRNMEVSTIYQFNKFILPNHIAFNNSMIAYINNDTVYSIDTNTDIFKVKTYQDKILKNSTLLLIKIINNTAHVFCKQGKDNYFIYLLSNKKRKKINFNFALGTVINNFKVVDDNYLISGYIKDPFLNDQYAYFTQTDLKGKMIWEKQEGKSDAVSVGFDMDIKHNLLYSKDNIINGKQVGDFMWFNSEGLKNISNARIINKNDRETSFFFRK